MSDLLQPPVGANEEVEGATPTITDPTIIAKLRDEIKGLKEQKRDLEGKWKAAEPVLSEYQKQQEAQKSEAQKLADQIAAINAKLAEQTSAAEKATSEAKLTRLAAKANINFDLLDLIDISKLDLNDEDATLKKLAVLATARQTANGASNPGRSGATGMTDDEKRDLYFNGGMRNKPTIFGG